MKSTPRNVNMSQLISTKSNLAEIVQLTCTKSPEARSAINLLNPIDFNSLPIIEEHFNNKMSDEFFTFLSKPALKSKRGNKSRVRFDLSPDLD